MIKQLSENGPVGVLKRYCIMGGVHTRVSDGTTPDQAYFTPPPLRLAA